MGSSMDMASFFGPMVHHTRETMLMVRRKAMVFSHIHQKSHTKVIGKMDYRMVKVVSLIKKEIPSKMDCGSMGSSIRRSNNDGIIPYVV